MLTPQESFRTAYQQYNTPAPPAAMYNPVQGYDPSNGDSLQGSIELDAMPFDSAAYVKDITTAEHLSRPPGFFTNPQRQAMRMNAYAGLYATIKMRREGLQAADYARSLGFTVPEGHYLPHTTRKDIDEIWKQANSQNSYSLQRNAYVKAGGSPTSMPLYGDPAQTGGIPGEFSKVTANQMIGQQNTDTINEAIRNVPGANQVRPFQGPIAPGVASQVGTMVGEVSKETINQNAPLYKEQVKTQKGAQASQKAYQNTQNANTAFRNTQNANLKKGLPTSISQSISPVNQKGNLMMDYANSQATKQGQIWKLTKEQQANLQNDIFTLMQLHNGLPPSQDEIKKMTRAYRKVNSQSQPTQNKFTPIISPTPQPKRQGVSLPFMHGGR